MTTKQVRPPHTARLAAYLEGLTTPEEALAIEVALHDDPPAAQRLEQLRQIRGLLAAPVPALENLELLPRVQTALAARAARADEPRGRWILLGASASAVLCCVLLLTTRSQLEHPEQLRSKALMSSQRIEERWAGVRVYRAASSTAVEPIGARISVHDQLLFSYTNLGPNPFAYLLIFAKDSQDRVHWYYPAYERLGLDPSAIPIEPLAGQTLPDLVAHDYAVGPIAIYALFVRQPLHVLEIERMLQTKGGMFAPEVLERGSLQVVRTEVVP